MSLKHATKTKSPSQPADLLSLWPGQLPRQISMNSWNPEWGPPTAGSFVQGHGLLVMMWHGVVSGGRMLKVFKWPKTPRKLLVKSSIFRSKSEASTWMFLRVFFQQYLDFFSIFLSDWDCTNGIQIITMKSPPRFKGEDFFGHFSSNPHPFQSPI